MDKEKFAQEVLERYDQNEPFSERNIRDVIEWFEIARDVGEARRWSSTIWVLLKIKDRFFVTDYEQGLTENQEDDYYDSHIKEVFNPTIVPIVKERIETYNADGAPSVFFNTGNSIAIPIFRLF